jgi:hypothetical protein
VEYVGRRNPSGGRDNGPVAHKGLQLRVGPLSVYSRASPAGERRDAVAILVAKEAEDRADGTGRRRSMCWRC